MWLLISDHQCLNSLHRRQIRHRWKSWKNRKICSLFLMSDLAPFCCMEMLFFYGLDLSKGVKKKTFHHIRNSGGESRYQKHNKTKMYHQWQDVAVRGAPHSEECSTFHVISNRDSQVASMQKKTRLLKTERASIPLYVFHRWWHHCQLIIGWLCLYILRWVSALSSRK